MPFALHHEAVGSLEEHRDEWIGSLDVSYSANYIDVYLLLIFGGIPWQVRHITSHTYTTTIQEVFIRVLCVSQVYFQRVLSAKSAARAQLLSFVAAFGCIVMAAPAALIGIIAVSTGSDVTTFFVTFHG